MKIFSVVIFLAFLLSAISYGLTMEGPWLDAFLSRYFSSQFDLELSVRRAKVRHWRNITFDSLSISAPSHSARIESGPGVMKWKAFPWAVRGREEAGVVIYRLKVPADFHGAVSIPFLPQTGVFGREFMIDRLRLSISKADDGMRYHVLECVSRDFRLQAGVEIIESKVSRFHALILLKEGLLQKLPEAFRSRLIRRGKDWEGLRVLYGRRLLTAIGEKGPFFKADWH